MKSYSPVILLAVLTSLSCVTNVPTVSKTAPPPSVTAAGLLTSLQPPDDERVYYQPPTLAERLALSDAATALFQRLRTGGDIAGLSDDFARAGLRVQVIPDQQWVVLWENGPTWRGAGVFLFRIDTTSDTVLQAPHRFHDRQTGEIALSLFRSTDARALFFNNLHRYRATPDERESAADHRADLAHTTDSYFYAITDAYLKSFPEARIVQLHGFHHEKLLRKGIEVVVSNGTDDPQDVTRRDTALLRKQLGADSVALYPDDVRKYGASANTIGRLVRLTQRGQFLHIELSPGLRDELEADVTPLRVIVK